MDRWSLGLKSKGVRPLTVDEQRRIKRLQLRFRMRLGKVVLWSLLWLSMLPLVIRFQEVLGGWGLLVWFVNVIVPSMVTGPWTANGLTHARKLGEDLRTGVAEILESTHAGEDESDAHATRIVVEALPRSGFVVTERGVPNEQWRLAPIRAVAGAVHSHWLDYFDGKAPLDRSMGRPMTKAERDEIERIRRRVLPRLLGGVIIVLFFVTLLLVIGSIFRDVVVHKILGIVGFLLVVPFPITHGPAWWLVWALSRDLKDGTVAVVSFGDASRAEGAPDSAEFLLRSRRLWSVGGAPAPWRILFGPPDHEDPDLA